MFSLSAKQTEEVKELYWLHPQPLRKNAKDFETHMRLKRARVCCDTDISNCTNQTFIGFVEECWI